MSVDNWFENVPPDWNTEKIRNIAFYSPQSISIEQLQDKSFYYYDIPTVQAIRRGREEEGNNIDSNKLFLLGGELLISKLNPRKGTVVLTESNELEIICSTEFVPLTVTGEIYDKFLYYVLSSKKVADYLNKFVKSATRSHQRVNPQDILNMRIPVPKKNNQYKIVYYLESKLDNLQTLISNKERLIKLLEQQRQSIITEAVTKGLNPYVKMKDSGVEWIGEIPEHWELKRLKNAVILNPSKNEICDVKDREVTFLPMENILAPNKVDISIKKKIEEVYNGYTYFKEEDLVLAKVTPCFENGNIAVMQNIESGIGFGTTELHVLRPKKQQNIYFYYYLAQTAPFKQQGISTMYGVGGLKRIPTEFILNYKFGMPPLSEQNEIVEFLNEKCRELESTTQLIKNQIEKLREYRQSLIYEAVTGKIDVRELELD